MNDKAKYSDSESRRLIVTDFEHTLFVDAGAGSGKTTAMVSRIIMIVLNGRADIREIVAITFTNEGAASLKSKIQQELEKANATGVYSPCEGVDVTMGEVERRRVRDALAYLPLAPIGTIHSFCLSLLKERPVEAGIDPKFEMNTEGNVVSAFDEAWATFILQSAAARHAFLQFIVDASVPLDAIKEVARIKYTNPDLELYTEEAQPVGDRDITKSFDRVARLVRDMYAGVGVLKADSTSAAGQARLKFVRRAHALLSNGTTTKKKLKYLVEIEVHEDWTQKHQVFAKATEEVKAITRSVRKRHLDCVHHRMAGFIREFERFFIRHRKATSSLEFEDLLFLARTMLRDHSGVREYFKRNFKYLFVDETQDIDPLQTEVVFFLSEFRGDNAREWTEVRLQPGKLFMVGDPKQSIYKFRRADITIYELAKESVEKQEGRVLSLDKNFRSAAPIIRFVNDHFNVSFGLFAEDIRARLQPEYAALQAGALRQSHLEAHLYLITSPDTTRKAGKQDTLDPEIAKLISFLLRLTSPAGPQIVDAATGEERPVHFRDVMVLMKTFTDVEVFARRFEQAGIPYQEVGGKTFFVSDDVRGMVFALKAIDDPTDTVALFGALKSPVIGVTDQELFDFVVGGRRLSIFADGEGMSGTLPLALGLFRNLHYTRENLRPSGVLKELFNNSGLCHLVLAEPNGLQKSAKYFRLLELLHEIETDQTRSFRSTVAALESVMEMDDPQLANVSITPAGENAVKLTTIHRAKGLETPVVVLANATITPRKMLPDSFVLREEGKILIPYGEDGGFYSRDPDELLALEARKEECEAERLRYVAVTRARDILVVCVPSDGTIPESFNGRLAPTLFRSSLVRRLQDELTPPVPEKKSGHPVDLQRLMIEARRAGEIRRESLRMRQKAMSSPFVSVHDVMEIDPDLFKVKRKSRGKGFGIVLHRIMQHHVADPAFVVESVLDQWMEEEDVPRRFRDDMFRSFTALAQHPLVSDARQSTEKHCEWEFYAKSGEQIMNGIIDLVFKGTDDTWVIVDYKTDDVSNPERRKELDLLYGRQLAAYAAAFEQITGHRVARQIIIYSEEETK